MCATAPTPGVSEIPPPPGTRISRASYLASGDGQLRHAQDSRSAAMAKKTSAFCLTFHSDQFELGEPGGALVWRVDSQGGTTRRLCERAGFDPGHRSVLGGLESESPTFCLDGQSRGHHG